MNLKAKYTKHDIITKITRGPNLKDYKFIVTSLYYQVYLIISTLINLIKF